VHVPGGVVGGGGRCLLGRRIQAAAGAATAAVAALVWSTGDWGSKSGGGGSVRTWGWTKPGTQAMSGGGGGTRRLRRGAQRRRGVSSRARGEGAGGASWQWLAKRGKECRGGRYG
jgi:hypothetical protein